MDALPRLPWVRVPPLNDFIKLYQDLAEVCGTFIRPKVAGIALNCAHLSSDQDALDACKKIEDETGLATTDPVRFGTARLLDSIPLRRGSS
jgi:uncharacterized NAD-dependent epimerase/dehydratase family protein